MSSMGLFWVRQWYSQIRKRRVIHSNSARHGLLLCETWRSHTGVDEDYALSTGEGLRTFRRNVVPSSWAVGPEDQGKLTSRQGETSQITWVFTNTALRISTNCCPETSARNYQSTLCKIPKERRSQLHRVRSLKSRNCGSVTFSAISMPRECTDWGWQGVFFVFLFPCTLVISDIRKVSHNR